MTTSPLAYFWGDDELGAARAIEALQRALGAELGTPPERWDMRGDRNRAPEQIAQLQERIATPVMFGGGSMAVVSNPGPLQTEDHRAAFLAMLNLVAPGNALVVMDATRSVAKAPSHKRLADAVAAAGGVIRMYQSPGKAALAGWIAAEAHARALKLAPGAAKTLAERIGGLVEPDVDRRHLTRMASLELDKLTLYRGDATITQEDVEALVAEAIPGSLWAFADAVSKREVAGALEVLDRLFGATPEPVMLAVLHKRIRELLELGERLRQGERLASAAKAVDIKSAFVADHRSAQARGWTADELTEALHGLVELDAMVKNAPGSGQDEAQHRLAFSLWVMDHATRTA